MCIYTHTCLYNMSMEKIQKYFLSCQYDVIIEVVESEVEGRQCGKKRGDKRKRKKELNPKEKA